MNRLPLCTLLALLAPGLLDAAQVPLSSNPAGATVRVMNPEYIPRKGTPSQWTTPATADLPRNRAGESYILEFSMEGHEAVRVPLAILNNRPHPAEATLPPLVFVKEVTITSRPTGAAVTVAGQPAGTAPLKIRLQFERPNSVTPWSTAEIKVSLTDYQSETSTVTQDPAQTRVEVDLARLKHDVTLDVLATTADGRSLERAHISVDGTKNAETPARITLPFHRPDKLAPWNQVQVVVGIPDEYEAVPRTFTYPAEPRATFALAPITEMSVIGYFPVVRMAPRGPEIEIDLTPTIGTVDDRDDSTTAIRTIRITSIERNQSALQAVNSFAITPDGQNVVYGVTGRSENGRYFSNLHLRSTSPSNSRIVQLTRDVRYLDCYPAMSRHAGTSDLVVFQSNRGSIDAMDISSFRLQEGRLIGGIQQLTREGRFNERPSISAETSPIHFSSLDRFPDAERRIASVRIDGTAYTNLGEAGQMVHFSEAPSGRIYFARHAEDSKKLQLYAILADGTGFETVLTDYAFSQANCHSPAISPDGKRLLFVSDYDPEKGTRLENNIWMIDLSSSRQPLQLTTNRSEDLAPQWSPTEPDVVYFLSNRRGVFNVWQMAFKSTR